MQIKSIFRFLILLIILLSLSKICNADVEIPFDYYYGRWVDGHQIGGSYEFQDNREDSTRSVSYLFTSGKYRYGFGIVTKSVLNIKPSDVGLMSVDEEKSWISPVLKFQIRPTKKWQLGIDSLYFTETTFSQFPINNSLIDIYSNLFCVDIHSHWTNKDKNHLSKYNAALSYFYNDFIDGGTVRIDNNLKIEQKSTSLDYIDKSHNYNSSKEYFMLSIGKFKTYKFNLQNTVRYGMTNDINLNLNLELLYNIEHTNDKFSRKVDSTYYSQSSLKKNKRNLTAIYNLRSLINKFKSLQIDIQLSQKYSYVTGDSSLYSYYSGDDSIRYLDIDYTKNNGFGNTNIIVGLNLLSMGDFNENMLLDNYNGFYRMMLSGNQLCSGLEFNYLEEHHKDPNPNSRTISLKYKVAYGLKDHLEISANVEYTKKRFVFLRIPGHPEYSMSYRNNINHGINIKFRSYKYNSKRYTNWSQDTKYDIVLGNQLSLGQLYFETNIKLPPQYKYSNDSIKLLSLSGFRNINYSIIEYKLCAGIGYGFVFEFVDYESYRNSKIYQRDYSIEINKRLLQKIRFSMKYEQSYYKKELTDPTITAEILALF